MKNLFLRFLIALFLGSLSVCALFAQERVITVPKQIDGAPFRVQDNDDLYAKAYRWFLEDEIEWAADSLRKLIDQSGFTLNETDYHIVVAYYNNKMSPIGMLHEGSLFTDTRLYGLTSANLYYIFISPVENAESFLSVTLTQKNSPFQDNLLNFLGLFFPIPEIPGVTTGPRTVWIDVRKFEIPEKFQKNSDISVIVKEDIQSEDMLATAVFDNTAREHWSFGMATAVTSLDDVQFVVSESGTIIVQPKPFLDLAAFGVVNYHFSAVDTKQPTLASSFHLLGGLRVKDELEPVIGLGFGFPTGIPVELHFFGGVSFRFGNKLKEGFDVGDSVNSNINPFALDIKIIPRYGIELKFP